MMDVPVSDPPDPRNPRSIAQGSSMTETEWKVSVGQESVTAAYQPASDRADDPVFVCAHGAGGHMSDRGILALSSALASTGLGVVRFNFVYRERKSGRPDPMPQLEQCFTAVVDSVREQLGPRRLIIGGRSMGGRAATMLAAEGFACDGLLLFAYPLHPAGQPGKLRDAHLPAIEVPVLCFNGTRDALCTPELMRKAIEPVGAKWTMHWLDGADHSFHVLKSSGRTDAAVLAEVAGVTRRWVKDVVR